ncbi:hypothetical protein SARC_01338 [Sphaeroforma arctica JP610]|uniref:Uncharacterized protein n=1 Tax=Sphaeroforma arctica JP610 TaxID=667725 RepID=A0A0L0GE22_9EUKA|nr:hypothetical protein SARC_01338 [Sphaeroforma arctica JP610]KNC86508.1 hypothetical protein SARC_01338 [Sphaeroforma arctica JP610]|eukprot:XP_014160410.1 hypothetical protein SARC_01338 [Sphaeroforma arctica JP610]
MAHLILLNASRQSVRDGSTSPHDSSPSVSSQRRGTVNVDTPSSSAGCRMTQSLNRYMEQNPSDALRRLAVERSNFTFDTESLAGSIVDGENSTPHSDGDADCRKPGHVEVCAE